MQTDMQPAETYTDGAVNATGLTFVEATFSGFHFLKSPSSFLYFTRGQVNTLDVFYLHEGCMNWSA